MKEAKYFLFIAAALLLLPSSCIHYMEQETPPGDIPPITSVKPVKIVRVVERTSTTNIEPSTRSGSEEIVTRETELTAPQTTIDRESDTSAQTVERFIDAYTTQGKPRIAVFFNRTLSDEVREWRTESRFVVSGDLNKVSVAGAAGESSRENASISQSSGTTVETQSGSISSGESIRADSSSRSGKAAVGKIKAEGGAGSIYEQQHIELENRESAPEDWMWQFEESFLRQFLTAKANMIDRAAIMRLLALESGKQGDPQDLLSTKAIETTALQDKADLLLELLVRSNPHSPVRYEFRASVKEVTTGRILANVSSLQWRQEEIELIMPRKYKATSRGYEIVDEGVFPKLDLVAETLALDVMESLTKIWSTPE